LFVSSFGFGGVYFTALGASFFPLDAFIVSIASLASSRT
jgi:hypothetical protein